MILGFMWLQQHNPLGGGLAKSNSADVTVYNKRTCVAEWPTSKSKKEVQSFVDFII
jgi:hypothetical protein